MVNVLTIRTICVVVTALCAPLCAWGQAGTANPTVDKKESARAVPPAVDREKSGAIATYQAYVDAPVSPWRQTNDRALAVGGWKAYSRQARSGDTTVPETLP
jgi:hypothetical protein